MAEFNQMDEWIVDDLVDSIQETHTIWREPFERDENVNSLPRSGVTGQVFKTNLEGFARLQRQYDFTDPRWMTRAELMSLGWDITDDARGVVVGRDNYDKDIVVFNVSQAQPQRGFENSIKPWNPEIKEKQWFNVARADFILESSGANIKYGFKNSQYNTVSDNICLPYQSNFRTADDYYWTAFHELMHWTGSNSRLARNTSGNKNSPLYAREELVAELGAYMMCLRTGVSFDKSNASAYINGWAENMQLDSASLKKELTLAWSEARRACDFVSRNVLMNMKKNNIKLDNSGRVYLNVEKEDVKEVISLGARYDTRQYAFYITPEHSFAKFNKYLDEAHRVSDISVSLVTKTENEYEREDDKAEEIRRGIEAEANAPPVEEPAVDMNSNLARYIAYRAIKSEPQLKDWCDSDIISEIRDASEYLDSSHFAHDVADILKKHIVASIAKYSKNSTEADIYEHWDRDVNAYVQDADSIFVRMDSAISFLKYHLKDSFEDNVNHIRMLDEAYHDDAFLALINPKVENTVTEEAEQVAEVSENSEFVQKNENEEEEQNSTEMSMSDALAELINQNPDVVASPEELLERHFQQGYQEHGYYQNIDFETFKKIDALLPQEADKENSLDNWYQWEHTSEDWNRADVINYISSDSNVLNYVLEKGQIPPSVFMHWSESGTLSDAFEKTGGFLPFAEADRIITAEDEEFAKLNQGYEKTKLTLLYLTNSLDGKGIDDQSYPHMRYDCGDLDGGLIKHIESWCDWCIGHYEDVRESMREYKTVHLPMIEHNSNQFEDFKQNQSQYQEQSNDRNWKIQWWRGEETDWNLELVCDGKVISSAAVSEDVSEKRLHRLINNFSEELIDYFDLPEEQLEDLTKEVENKVNGFMMSIKNVVELGHENQETVQTTVENNTNNNYTDTNTSVLVESKENLDHEISSGMGGESRSSSTRTADEGLGADARNGQSSEVGEGSDHRTEGRAGTLGSDDGRGGRSGILPDDAQNVSGSIGSGRGYSGLRGRGSEMGEGADASTHQSHEGEQTGEFSDRGSQEPVVSRTSGTDEGISSEVQGLEGRANPAEQEEHRSGHRGASGDDQSGIESASRGTESGASQESANGIGNEADGESRGRLRSLHADGTGESDRSNGVLDQGNEGLGERELSSGERVSSVSELSVHVPLSAGQSESRNGVQEDETRSEMVESVLQSGVQRGLGDSEAVVLGDDQRVSGQVLEELGSRDQRTGSSGEDGDSERAEVESAVRSESDPQSSGNQSDISGRTGRAGQSEGLDDSLSARSGASGKDFGRAESQGRTESGISSGSRRERGARDDSGKHDLDSFDFGDLSNHVIDEEADSNDTVIDVSDVLGNQAEQTNAVSSENNVPATRYHITDFDIGAGGEKTRLSNNMEALRTLKLLEKENRNATPEEQEKLAKYVGWGGLSNVFNPSRHEFEKERKELKELLNNREYNDARASTLTAFYTPPEVIQSIYRGLKKAGFKGGRILEPSCGVGNFFGMLPESMANSELHGVELDSVSAKIAQKLYPDAQIEHDRFENFDHKGYFDVVIGNVPFASLNINDPNSRYDGNVIHNYFVGKAVEQVREGGIVALVTSTSTLDSEKAVDFRNELAKDADLIGAFRLPEGVFSRNAGTSVSSDIVFLQKRNNRLEVLDEKADRWANGSREIRSYFDKEGDRKWVVNTVYDREDRKKEAPVNLIFQKENGQLNGVCGDFVREKDRFGKVVLAVKKPLEGSWQEKLREEVEDQIQDSVYQDIDPSKKAGFFKTDEADANEDIVFVNSTNTHIGIGSMGVDGDGDGDVLYRKDPNKFRKLKLSKDKKELAVDWIKMKDQLNLVKKIQISGDGIENLAAEQATLRSLYEDFAKKHGRLNGVFVTKKGKGKEEDNVENENPNIKDVVGKDKDYYSVRFIEQFDEKYNFTGLSKICYERVLGSVAVHANAETESDALAVSMNTRGRVDLDYMSELLGNKDKSEIVKNLEGEIFLVPNIDEEIYQTKEEYLSGDVVKKLEEAKYAVDSGDARFENNVNALIGVQPAKRDFTEIGVSLGSHWVPVEHVQNFVNSITGGVQSYNVNYDRDASAFSVRKIRDGVYGDERQFEFSSGKINKKFKEILEDTLNSKFIQVKASKNSDSDNAITPMQANDANVEITQIQKSLSERYKEWLELPEQQAVREDIEAVYNRKFNSVVPREYDGSHLSFDGMNPTIKLKPHQKGAVAHTLFGGSTLVAHEVGAGKTFELIASAMEAKRLGLAQKTLILVPNAVLGQWGQDIYKLYPDCKALVPTMDELKAENRADFMQKLAHNDFDIVVMPQSTFDNNIRVSKERQTAFIDTQIDVISEALAKKLAEGGVEGRDPTVKNLQLRINKYRSMLEKLNKENQERAENKTEKACLDFEELGCDRLYVDEAHSYKNAPLWTSLNARNLGSATGDPSTKALNMMMTTEYINDITDERGVVFATGTPLTNSISEVYAMQTYISPSKLKEKEINCLDDFISAFAVIDKEYELKPAQTEYVQEERLRSFNNLKELKTMFREFTDIALTEDLGLKLPKANYEVITADISPNQEMLMQELSDRITNLPNVNPKDDNMLKVTSDGRKVGLDPRLYNPDLPDEAGTKLNLVADKVAQIYKTSAPTDTQLIFSDLGVPGKGKAFDVYSELTKKLIERGVPEDQIADVYSCGNNDKKRSALFAKVNEGKIRILMGSTEKLGTGVNVQKNLLAVHHVDVKWRPSDLTQRNGRIIRQGNVHDSVNIYNYVTDKTFDAYQYQTLLMKQKFIKQFMSANDSVANSMTDLDDQTLSINEALACCAGDPNITKKAKLEGEIMYLAKEKSNFEKRKSQAKNRINSNERSIEIREAEKAQIETYQAKALANPAGSPIVINGKQFTDRKLAGEELARMAIGIEKNQTGRIVKVAEYRGLDIGIQITHNNAGVLERNFHVIHKSALGTNFIKRMSEAKDLTSNMNFIDDIIDKQIPYEIGLLDDRIKELHKESEGYKPVLAQTWNKQDSLTALHDELMEVYAQLSVDPPLNIRKIFDVNGLASKIKEDVIVEDGVHDYGLPEDPEKKARMEKLWDELQAVLSDRHEMSMPEKKERVYFDVPYEQRQEAKALGCKWDKDNKKWFISEATPERIEAMDKAGFKTVEVEQKNLESVQKNENLKSVQKNENTDSKQKILLSVPFEEKDLAKELGAKFDRETKCWYVPEGMDLKPFERWKPTVQHEKTWIKAPYEMHEQIKELGARYDGNAKCWFVPENVDLKPFEELKLNQVQSEKTDTPIAFFVEKMREAGLVIDKYPDVTGRSTRVAVEGDKTGQTSGWYKIHADGVPVCLFQNWRSGEGVQKLVAPANKIDMSIDLEKVKVNAEVIAAKLSSQDEATKQLHAEVAKNVQERLALYKESESTQYIQNKEIPIYKGIFATNRGVTVIPLADVEGNIRTMQTILPAGTKMFEKGGELKGSMHVVNADNLAEVKGGIVICEGYATGATIREATNGHFGVVCAMTSHNLHDVAKAISEKYPDKPLIIAGDNDRFNANGNVGKLTAEAVATEFGAKVVIPEFNKENDRGSDFNDLKKSEGLDKVKTVFRQLLQNKEERQEEKVEKKKSRSR